MHTITDEERRARLVDRHHLARTAADSLEAVRAIAAVHSSDPATPYLSARARIPGFQTEHLDHALYGERTLWRLHAMRRTLFVVPFDDAAVFLAGASQGVADKERRKIEQWLAREMTSGRVGAWLAGLADEILAALADGPASTQELSAAVPELTTQITVGSGKWTTEVPLSSRLLLLMAMEGRVVRTRPAGSWRSSQYRWATVGSWFGRTPVELERGTGQAELARRYLAAYGPATMDDVRWWTGWTAKQATSALQALGAVAVELEPDSEGFVLPDDVEQPPAMSQQATLLPALDSTPMGWKRRDWYLGPHADRLFDRNGNAGPTVWIGGRVVGGWAQRADGRVVYELLEAVGSDEVASVEEEAAALTEWLAGAIVVPRFRTPLERRLSAGTL